MEAEKITWQWNKTGSDITTKLNGSNLNFVYDETSYTGKIEFIDSSGKVETVWKREELFAESALLLKVDYVLFVALYSQRSTGCCVLALNLSSWETLWERELKGLGSVGHSRYRNKVQMSIIESYLVIFGWESDGKYIEILDPVSGDLVLNRKI